MSRNLYKAVLFILIVSTILCSCGLNTPINQPIDQAVADGLKSPLTLAELTLRINEFSTSNTQTLADEDGDFVGWVEIYNYGDKEISLKGLSLSDNKSKPDKWYFPDITIKNGGYLIVYLSNKEKVYADGKNIHASFSLSNKDETIGIYNGNQTVTQSNVVELISNVSYGYGKDGKYCYFSKATPGKENTGNGFDSIDSANMCKEKEIVISEMCVTSADSYDYIELYNPSDKPVSLSSYRLSDSSSPQKAIKLVTEAVIKPKSYYSVYCSNSTYYDKKNNRTFVDIGLNRYGEDVVLTDNNGFVVDCVQYGRAVNGYTCGRDISKDSSLVYFPKATPSAANSKTTLKKPVASPQLSLESSFVNKGTTVSAKAEGSVIRYTLDGSEPNEKSPELKENLLIDETVTLRTRAFKEGHVPSEVTTATYIVGRKPSMPVFFVTADEKDLFSNERGILASNIAPGDTFPYQSANYWKDWERPANIQYLDEKGNAELNFNAGIKVFGQYSRALPQKSLSVNLKDKYGPKEICYPFFNDNEVNVFSSFVLRNSGQDNSRAFLRDAFCAMVIKNQVDVAYMDYKPVVVYINGEYYGIYDLREKIDEDYFANHEGIDSENIDIIKGFSTVKNGSIDSYNQLMDYLSSHDLSKKENYDYISSIVDIDNVISYWMIESFFNNTDTGNIKYYRENTDGAKWRIALFDLDWALFPTTYKNNMVKAYINPKGHGYQNSFSTKLMCSLIKNKDFRTRLIEINSEHFKTTFDKERMLGIYDDMVKAIDEEMKYHTERWGSPASYETWKKECASLRKIISERPELFKNAFCETFNLTAEEKAKYF